MCLIIIEKNNTIRTMSVMLCTGATFEKKKSCSVARVVSFDTVGLNLVF